MPDPCLDLSRIRAISLDLDDTLWPIWPTIARAEAVLLSWLTDHAPATAARFSSTESLRALRNQMETLRPDLLHDLSGLRRESIRWALTQAGEAPHLADTAFEVFFSERQRVQLFDGAQDALAQMAARYPVVALSNGNADVHRVGIGQHFRASIRATDVGIAKPDPRIFHLAAQAVDVPSEAVLHVGDDATMDAWGAMGAGMQAVWVNPQGREWPHDTPPPAMVRHVADLPALLA